MAVTSEYLHANTSGEMECVKREEGKPRVYFGFSLCSRPSDWFGWDGRLLLYNRFFPNSETIACATRQCV